MSPRRNGEHIEMDNRFPDHVKVRTSLYNASIEAIEMPARIRNLPVSPTGFPVPWFVHFENGVPDFRVIRRGALLMAYKHKRCWVCGHPLGRVFAMTLGPMCIINRTISEPPSHRECAVYSAIACPFLSNPRMRRNEVGLPEEHIPAAGDGIKRNPGAVAVWMTRGYKPFKAYGGSTGTLFTFDDPEEVLWFAEGRPASRDEVMASIDSGYPLLLETAVTHDGPEGVAELEKMRDDALRWLPRVGG